MIEDMRKSLMIVKVVGERLKNREYCLDEGTSPKIC